MSKVETRGEVSPLTAAAIAFLILAVSGFSVWRFVFRETITSLEMPAIVSPASHSATHGGASAPDAAKSAAITRHAAVAKPKNQ